MAIENFIVMVYNISHYESSKENDMHWVGLFLIAVVILYGVLVWHQLKQGGPA